jgi:membrane fusion protein, multidrug efflux system
VVQRVPVKIVLDPNPSLGALVRPGMSVEATVETGGMTKEATSSLSREKQSGERPGGL